MHDYVSLYACIQSMITGGGKQILFETKPKLSQQTVYIHCSVWYRFVFFLLQLNKHALKGILSIHVFAFTRYPHYLSIATFA